MEAMKKENIQLKSITKDDDEVKEVQRVNIYKNYIPLCLIEVVVCLFVCLSLMTHQP